MYSHTSTIVAFIAFIKFFKFYHLFTSLKILKILNDLKALIAPKLPWTELISPIIKSIIEITTISASKTLKGFDKKFLFLYRKKGLLILIYAKIYNTSIQTQLVILVAQMQILK